MKDSIECEIRVRYAETDQMGIAYYSNYLVWFEVGRSEFCRRRGFSYADLEAMGYKLVVTEAHCRYRNGARYDEILTIQTWLKEMNRRMITFSYKIYRKGKDELIVDGETRHICLGPDGKPKRLPEEFAKRLYNLS